MSFMCIKRLCTHIYIYENLKYVNTCRTDQKDMLKMQERYLMQDWEVEWNWRWGMRKKHTHTHTHPRPRPKNSLLRLDNGGGP